MEQWVQRNRGAVGREGLWVERASGYRGTVSREGQWAERGNGYRGTVGTDR